MEFPKSIKGTDIELIKLEPTFENARNVFDVIDYNREFLGQWLNWVELTTSPEAGYPFVQRTADLHDGGYYIQYQGITVGHIGLFLSEKNKSAEIGYWLDSRFGGRGIMGRALDLLVRFAFEKMDVNRVEILADEENIPSQNVAIRANFVQEGVLRQSMLLHNAPRNMIMFSKLKSEWEKENKNA